MKPFLLLQTRPEDEVSDNEYEAFCHFGGLTIKQLERRRVESRPLGSIDLHLYSGILIGGGPYNASDAENKKSETQKRVEKEMSGLLDIVIAQDFPLFGACYGIGLVVPHQGGIVSRKYGEEVQAKKIRLTEAAASDPILRKVKSPFRTLLGHKEACEVLPPNAVLLASSSTCPVQMFRIKQNIYVTQFHPELDGTGLEVRIRAYAHHGYFAPEDADKLIAMGHRQPITEPEKILRNFVKHYQK